MHHEHIHACPALRKEHPHYDCIFINADVDLEGMRGMSVAEVLTFFSFTYRAIIHIDSIYSATHLIPIYSSQFISLNLQHYHNYNSFHKFYIKYADHHTFKIAS
ncbi:hypothetical protein BDR04DRAFT_1032162 [Suillus decipiens]|nr:hypothetical protein BDR04DRAFT_1032162 [Suillus decipiens]